MGEEPTRAGGLADLLARRREAVLEDWAARATRLLDERLARPALIDNLPSFLDGLERALRQGRGGGDALRAAAIHGAERQEVGLALEQVLREYTLLRQVVYDELDRAGYPPTVEELRVFSLLVDGAVATAASRFARERGAALAAREREARRASLLLELGDAFFELDADFRIVRVNANQERLSRKPRSETVGRTFLEVWPELAGSRYEREYRRAMRDRVPVEFEEHYAPLDLWTDVTVYPVEGAGIAVFFRDATARKENERRLEEGRRFQQQLLGIVSHDLRNPLTAVQLGARTLLRREDLGAAGAGVAQRILSASERATRLISDLLDLTQARLGAGIPVQPRPADLGAIAEEVLRELSVTDPGRAIELRRTGDLAGEWDADRVAQVIGNLLTNALKYGDASAPVTLTLVGEAGEVRGEVWNAGAPIPAEVLPTLFEPLSRGPSAERAGRSVGLGLFIVRELVRAHGGAVAARSEAGAGTTFRFTLPRRPPDRAG